MNKDWEGVATATFAAALETGALVPAENGYAAEAFEGILKLEDGRQLTKDADTTQLVVGDYPNPPDDTFDPENWHGKAWCEACGDYKTWTPIAASERIGSKGDIAGAKQHYYLSGSGSYTGGQFFEGYNGTFCLHLNGQEKTLGGRISLGANTVFNVIGDGTITFTPNESLGETYRTELFDAPGMNAAFYFYGGTFIATDAAVPLVRLSTQDTSAAYIMADGVTFNGAVQVDKGVFTLAKDAEITNINVAEDGKLVVNSDFTGNAAVTFAAELEENNLVPEANGAATEDYTGTLTDATSGEKIVYNAGRLQVMIVPKDAFDPTLYGKAWCEACGMYIDERDWVAVHAPLGTTAENGKHYYIANDFTDDETTRLATTNGSDTWKGGKICFNLNGQNISVKNGFYVASSSRLNVMGTGSITYTGTSGQLFHLYTNNIYLYGGTYSCENAGCNVITTGGGGAAHLLGNTVIDGAVKGSGTATGDYYLYGSAKVESFYILVDGTLYLQDGWEGTINSVTFAAALEEDGAGNVLVPAANAVVRGTLDGTVKLDTGVTMIQSGSRLKADATFAPTEANGYKAYCKVCKTTATWTVCDTGSGALTAGDYHLYLSQSVTDSNTTSSNKFFVDAQKANVNVHFNTNGKNLTVTNDGAGYNLFYMGNGECHVFNTDSNNESVLSGETTAFGAYLAAQNSRTTLYSGVTLASGVNTATPTVAVQGGSFTMKGGKITAEGTNKVAVQVRNVANYNSLFTLDGGEIIGGNASAIQVGHASADSSAAGFVMNGGTITGGTASNGGSIYATGYCTKLELLGGTIQNGDATSNGGNVYIAANCASPVINGVTIQDGEAVNGGNLWLGVDTTITKATISGGEATTRGGNIYALGVDLTIEANATIQNGTVGVEDNTTGYGGGNIFFGQGTLTTSGTITGGKAHAYNGAGGNIFLDNGQTVGTHFIMNGGEISGGQLMGHEDNGSTGQAYGANIRAYRVKSMEFNAGTIFGGIGGADSRAHGRDVFISTDTAKTLITNVTIGNGFVLNGAYYQGSNSTLTMVGAPQIGGEGIRIGNEGMNVKADVSGLTSGASINLNSVVAGDAFTTETATEAMVDYFHVEGQEIMCQGSCLWIVAAKVGETCYATTDAAVAAANGKVVVMAVDGTVNIPAGTTAKVDAAGHNITVTGSGTLQAMDSSNKDFDGCGVWTILGVEKEPVTRNDGDIYVLILNEDLTTYSAHYLDIRISAVNLRTSSAGLYYTAEYKCDAVLAANIRSYGVGLSVYNMPANELDPYSSYTSILTNGGLADKLDVNNTIKIYSGAVTNIFTNDAENSEKNAENAAIEIYANAYLEIDTVDSENTYVFGNVGKETVEDDAVGANGDGAVYNMGKVLEAIDDLVENGTTDQVKTLIKSFCQKWTNTFAAIKEKGYSVQNIINLATNA